MQFQVVPGWWSWQGPTALESHRSSTQFVFGTAPTLEGWTFQQDYHIKAGDVASGSSDQVSLEFEGEIVGLDPRKLIYVRSAYRHEPDFHSSSIQRSKDLFAATQSPRMIDPESKVSDNYQRLAAAAFDDLFSGDHDEELVQVVRDRHIGRIREAMLFLFPDLELQGPGDPIGGGTFYFRKNGQPQFHYKNLSGGEKAAFDLVLDLVVKTAAYDDTVFFIDEPEIHLNTRVQGTLLELLLKLTPPEGQLWIATHSIGMMRRAQALFTADPSSVVFLDFENHDFDQPVTITPAKPDRDFWARVLHVALDDLAELVAPDRVVLCEGRPAGEGNAAKAEFDAQCYARIFAEEYPDTAFLSIGNESDVSKDRFQLGRAIEFLVPGTKLVRVVDRDLKTDEEIAALERTGTRVLRRRHLESYLLDEEIVVALCQAEAKGELAEQAKQLLKEARSESVEKGKDPDDIKSLVAGAFFVQVRRLLGLVHPGSTTGAFLRDRMAPLVTPSTRTYRELKQDIFGVADESPEVSMA
ncbi:MAG: AAA family ATPase [Actinomycetota bacterium]